VTKSEGPEFKPQYHQKNKWIWNYDGPRLHDNCEAFCCLDVVMKGRPGDGVGWGKGSSADAPGPDRCIWQEFTEERAGSGGDRRTRDLQRLWLWSAHRPALSVTIVNCSGSSPLSAQVGAGNSCHVLLPRDACVLRPLFWYAY
jgi:hypothetical protein